MKLAKDFWNEKGFEASRTEISAWEGVQGGVHNSERG